MKQKTPIKLTSYIDYSSHIVKNARPIFKHAVELCSKVEIQSKTRFFSTKPKEAQFQISAKAALSAAIQNKFDEMHELLMAYQGIYTKTTVFEMAESIGLDMRKFSADFESKAIAKRLEDDIKIAKKRGVNLAPSITINGYLYTGVWDEDALIEDINHISTKAVEQAMKRFIAWGASAAIALLSAAILALIVANIGLIEAYNFLSHFKLGFIAGDINFVLPIEVWVNDGLMAIFFLLIGLEIKREIVSGELSDRKRAAMPVIGAIGGMLLPALLYLLINFNGAGRHGWGIPMATDIAFTLGLMALLGSKVPAALKVFISALAVSDDLGAILVIALFYGHDFNLAPFMACLIIIAMMFLLNSYKVYTIPFYIVLGILLWFFIYQSGLHATLAGVITAILIPSRHKGNIVGISSQASLIFDQEIERIKDTHNSQKSIRYSSLHSIQRAIDRLIVPGEQIELSVERTVNYFILPFFAFFNTGILIIGTYFNILTPINLGIIIGLCIGKPLGIISFCWLAHKFKIASLSDEISWPQLLGAACLAGVGFTMSIVMADSVFQSDLLDGAKLSILIASTISALMGLFILNTRIQHTN
ncbi:MAG: Na+/H+ antiporter NhaA [Chitinophagales bacterium]